MRFIKQVIIAFITLVFWTSLSLAASTQWQDLGGGKARLVAVKDPIDQKITGFIEFDLEEGWKTYWRSPGDAGIPPEFNFSGSNFVDLKKIYFPKPEIVTIPDTYFMGYKGNVKFVFEADSLDENASLSLDLLAGVCEEVCIPATAQFSLSPDKLNVTDPKALMLLEGAKTQLPKLPYDEFKVSTAHKTADTQITFSALLPENGENATFLLEGPNGWFSGPVEHKDGAFVVRFVEGFDSEAGWYHAFRYTILSGDQSIEGQLSEFEIISK